MLNNMAKPLLGLQAFVPGVVTAEGERICCSVVGEATKLQCSICKYVMEDPMFLGCCAQYLCNGCVKNIKQSRMHGPKCCPFCNQEFTTLLNQHLQKQVHQLKVLCPNASRGCPWKGRLDEVTHHITPQPMARVDACRFQLVPCKHANCKEKVLMKDLRKHENDICKFRMYTCKYCLDVTDTFEKVSTEHFPVCPDYTMACPNKCAADYMMRSAVDEHLRTSCPNETVTCDYMSAGCKMRCQRKDMPAHYETALHHHNSLLVDQNAALLERVADSEQKLSRVVQQQAERNSQFGELLRQQDSKQAILEAKIAELTAKSEGRHRPVTASLSGGVQKDFAEKMEMLEKKIVAESGKVRTELTGVISHVLDAQEEAKKEVADAKNVVSSVQKSLEYVEKCVTPQPPFAFTVSRFSERKFQKEPFVSAAFYTHPRGYKMCVRVDLHGMDHVAVHCCVMKGEHDQALGWPFRGDVYIHIQNQLGDHHHFRKVIKYDGTTGENKSRRVSTGDMNYLHGFNQFIPHKSLGLDQANNCQYLKGDAVDFEVVRVDVRS